MRGADVRVLIVGAGIAGLATARCVRDWGTARGHTHRHPQPLPDGGPTLLEVEIWPTSITPRAGGAAAAGVGQRRRRPDDVRPQRPERPILRHAARPSNSAANILTSARALDRQLTSRTYAAAD
jgi:hypothetical protein